MPEAMVIYMRHNGPHFNRKLLEFALSKMYKRVNGRREPIAGYTKEQVKSILDSNGIKLQNDQLYDSVYVANMCKADYFGSSIEDKKHVAKYIKDTLDDEDAAEGEVFECFLAKCDRRGVRVDWEDMI